MKVVTNITVHHRDKKDEKPQVFEPGEHDLPDPLAKSLIKGGHAKPAEVAKAEAQAQEKAQAGTVQVRTPGKSGKAK